MLYTYLAFLRGINVGGHSLIKMSDLKEALSSTELESVSTYIQSGNIIFQADTKDVSRLADLIHDVIQDNFSLDVKVAIFSKDAWRQIIGDAPPWWGKDSAWKHNLLIMIQPYDMNEVVDMVGKLRSGMEMLHPGDGVLYQSVDFKMIGRAATGSKLASNPIYKMMTIRNYNTATKLLPLLDSI